MDTVWRRGFHRPRLDGSAVVEQRCWILDLNRLKIYQVLDLIVKIVPLSMGFASVVIVAYVSVVA